MELLQHLAAMIETKVATIVCGDFNICYNASRNNRVTQYLENNGFKQMMKEATHIKGRIIDHFYFKPGKGISEKVSIFRYSPYYSDHDATCATVTKIDS